MQLDITNLHKRLAEAKKTEREQPLIVLTINEVSQLLDRLDMQQPLVEAASKWIEAANALAVAMAGDNPDDTLDAYHADAKAFAMFEIECHRVYEASKSKGKDQT